ncbi:macro domain-containing protein [Lachnospira multipara]|uniref:Macro domain-containing protein n=1 Tax=Lachnospira multipara TaxID=28051 RepID=A0A1H5UDY0_9FIRM|nr:macro domain-containing protein [Lachnospira multipara]SEF73216.1 hypothetical protein SAMN05216537_10732 [Lachnospira multipara]
MACLAVLFKTVKPFHKNPNASDEDMFNDFISPLVDAGNIKNKNKEPLWLNKGRVSELLNQKKDVPKALRDALTIIGIDENIESYFKDYIDDFLEEAKIPALQDALFNLSHKTDSNRDILYKDRDMLAKLLTQELRAAISENNKNDESPSIIWKRGKNRITVIEGDLFKFGFDNRGKDKNIVVIPVNTSFETHVTRKFEGEPKPIVSATSIHGQWLTRAEQSGLTNLDKRIQQSLDIDGIKPSSTSKSDNTKTQCYPIGTIAVIEDKNCIYYLTAISQFNQNNNAQSSAEDIGNSVKALIEYHNTHGQGYSLYLPLLGTGLSRAGLSYQESYDIIKETLLSNIQLIQGFIFIVFPRDELAEIIL